VQEHLAQGMKPVEVLRRLLVNGKCSETGAPPDEKNSLPLVKGKGKDGVEHFMPSPGGDKRGANSGIAKTNQDGQLLVAAHVEPFDLRIVVPAEGGGDAHCFMLQGLTYSAFPDGRGILVAELAERLAVKLSRDPRQLRLLLWGGLPGAAGAAMPHGSLLAAHRLHCAERVEVHRKQRGGKKPGRGWLKPLPEVRLRDGAVVGAGARHRTALSAVPQAAVHVRGCPAELLLGLAAVLGEDVLVLCGSEGAAAALRQQLLQFGCADEGTCSLRSGERRLHLAAETEAEASEKEGCYRRPGSDKPLLRCSRLPEGAHLASLVAVYGALRDVTTLGKVLWLLRSQGPSAGAGVHVLHLVGVESVVVEKEGERDAVEALLSADGSLSSRLELHGQHVPAGAKLKNGTVSLEGHGLPVVLDFYLGPPDRSFLKQLQHRCQCTVPEVPYRALSSLGETSQAERLLAVTPARARAIDVAALCQSEDYCTVTGRVRHLAPAPPDWSHEVPLDMLPSNTALKAPCCQLNQVGHNAP